MTEQNLDHSRVVGTWILPDSLPRNTDGRIVTAVLVEVSDGKGLACVIGWFRYQAGVFLKPECRAGRVQLPVGGRWDPKYEKGR